VALTALLVSRSSAGPDGATGYRIGDPIDFLGVTEGSRRETLYVFLSSDCGASQSIVAGLKAALADLEHRVGVVAVVGRAAPSELLFAESAGFGAERVRVVDFRTLQLRVVPSLVLVGSDGRVKMERVATTLLGPDAEVSRVGSLLLGS
jgi:hypothetical protein